MAATTGVFVFRRDLRLDDNRGLARLVGECPAGLLPVFVFDPRQCRRTRKNRNYFSANALQFLCESVEDLDRDLRARGARLAIAYGRPEREIVRLARAAGAGVVGWNADWSPFARARDEAVRRACERAGLRVVATETDDLLTETEVLRDGATPYRRFAAFRARAEREGVPRPVRLPRAATFVTASDHANFDPSTLYAPNPQLAQRGGRRAALRTTGPISAALNFGCVSAREAFLTRPARNLRWRDFFRAIVRGVPRAADWDAHTDRRFESVAWRNDPAEWKRLVTSRTGFLLVDAAMREMTQTGFTTNRMRMILAVFWTKYLRIDPTHPVYGAQVGFSRHLVDAAGPSQNLMNHRWVLDFDDAGRKYAPRDAPLSGRPMNVDERATRRFDPRGKYVRRWIPELAAVPTADLLRWRDRFARHPAAHVGPMFDASSRWAEWVRSCREEPQKHV